MREGQSDICDDLERIYGSEVLFRE
jgi:hypothetical protein